MITRLAIAGYRSLRDVRLSLGRLNAVTGANGAGKSSLYRALRLIADIAQGRVIRTLAAEGGFQSALWAGPEKFSRAMKAGEAPVQGGKRSDAISLKLGFAGDEYGYAIDLGLPIPSGRSAFNADPQIKAEALWTGERIGRANVLAERKGPSVRIRDSANAWRQAMTQIAPFDSMLTQCSDPREAFELLVLRDQMRDWRFYDHLRTDREAPARRAQIGTYTPVLSGEGDDLAAAVQTVREIGDGDAFDEAIADAFPGASVAIVQRDGYFDIEMRQHGLLRPLRAAELSDGTLRYLLLTAALLSPRPPRLMVLNEPETSLHPDLLAPLGRLIARASIGAQIIVVSHAQALIAEMEAAAECRRFELAKELGETIVRSDAEEPGWTWPSR